MPVDVQADLGLHWFHISKGLMLLEVFKFLADKETIADLFPDLSCLAHLHTIILNKVPEKRGCSVNSSLISS